MYRKLILNLFTVSLLLWAYSVTAQQSPQSVLFVGNSYFYYNNSLHNHVKALIEADQPAFAKKLDFKSATIGGAELQHHQIEWLIDNKKIGGNQPFEWVILAGNSADALEPQSSFRFEQTVKNYDQIIRAHGAKTALYMVHAYVAPHPKANPENIKKVELMYKSVANQVGAMLIPVGLAFEESYKRRPELKLHNSLDGSHPSIYGTYLAACVIYAKLYLRTPIGNSYNMSGQVTEEIKDFLQTVAWDIVQRN